jgi:beta-lactamase regulating signal transducer with metallopeptidase domain
MAICWYLLEANIYLSIAYLFYTLLLKRYTFFQQHRYYLLFVSVFCFIIPLISWKAGDIIKPSVAVKEIVEPVLFPNANTFSVADQVTSSLPLLDIGNLLLLLIFLIAVLNVTRLIYGVVQIVLLRRRSEKVMQDEMTIVLLTKQQTVFSFFNWIFSHRSFMQDRLIREHEMIHARELHSMDILWFELVRAVNWINPVSHLLLKSAKLNHEFIVDAKLAEKHDPYAYAMMLITHARPHSSGLTHAAFASCQIEKRMSRMIAERSPRSSRSIFLLLFPLLLPLICFSVFKLDKSYAVLTSLNADQFSAVADQESIDKERVYQNVVVKDMPENRLIDTLPGKQVKYSQLAIKPVFTKGQTVTEKDTVYQQKKELPTASLYPSADENRQETGDRPHNIENRGGTAEKQSVYGKYASLVSADTAADYDKSLRRLVSVYPANRYAEQSGSGAKKFVNAISLFDSTKYRSAFQ